MTGRLLISCSPERATEGLLPGHVACVQVRGCVSFLAGVFLALSQKLRSRACLQQGCSCRHRSPSPQPGSVVLHQEWEGRLGGAVDSFHVPMFFHPPHLMHQVQAGPKHRQKGWLPGADVSGQIL